MAQEGMRPTGVEEGGPQKDVNDSQEEFEDFCCEF